jgi:polyisoprenoid-binding protein YceI
MAGGHEPRNRFRSMASYEKRKTPMSSSPTATPSVATYNIDPAHSSAHFKVRHMMISNVRGEFGKISGTLKFDAANPANSSITAEIAVHSINTREPDRDKHLKSADFFDVENHPTIRFQSKKVEPIGAGEYKVTGDLTIRGTTREVVLQVEGPTPEVKDPWGNMRLGAEASGKISRKDFGVVYNAAMETGGVMIGDEIEISLAIELVKAA